MDVDVEPKINLSHKEIRVLLLHEFRLGPKTTEAANNICSTMNQSLVSARTAQREYGSFKAAYRRRSSIDFTGIKGVVHWELLPNGYTITTDPYCQQLDRVAEKLKGNQDRVYFLHGNATPHIAKSTRENLLKLGWITVPHPPYSPDLASTDYHLFRSLSNDLRDKQFKDESDVKTELVKLYF
ncbi:unnamed protein product [Adineta ricciae]|uniref:Mos1 transposase HTH domain-containing protein n=1 Tax=Adineta ricciae TaxID=249248 RepID=A0A815VXQ7_ADIRI|nr:unnamed protein product [Adineta ricciae]CAF1538649.1 unnamed protein product [Adineta ricciae]